MMAPVVESEEQKGKSLSTDSLMADPNIFFWSKRSSYLNEDHIEQLLIRTCNSDIPYVNTMRNGWFLIQ